MVWLVDAVVMRHAHRINGFSTLLNKLDVLGGLDELKICVAYELDGAEITEMPSSASALARCKPIYVTDLDSNQNPLKMVRRCKACE